MFVKAKERADANQTSKLQFVGEIIGLTVILLVSIFLRFRGLHFGLPHIYNTDEGFEVYRALRLGTGELDFDRVGKGGYFYILFFEFGLYFFYAMLTGIISDLADFAKHFVRDPTPFWLIGRATTATLGVVTVLLLWRHSRLLYGPLAAVSAALFLAVSSQHILDSHFITVDVPMTLFAFWAVTMIVEDVQGQRRLNPYLFASCGAFAIATKLPAIVILVPYLLGCLQRGGIRGDRGLFSWSSIQPILFMAAIYLILEPGIIVTGGGALVRNMSGLFTSTSDVEAYNTSYWQFYLGAIVQSQGVAIALLAVSGPVIAIFAKDRAALLHFSFIVPFLLLLVVFSTPKSHYHRYIVPILPSLCLVAAFAVQAVYMRLEARHRAAWRWFVPLVIVGAVALPAGDSVRVGATLGLADTRTQAANWFAEFVPTGKRILLEGFEENAAAQSIPLRNTRRKIEELVARLSKTDPGKSQYWQLYLDEYSEPSYDLMAVRHFDEWGTLGEYLDLQVDYVVLRRDFFVMGGSRASSATEQTVESRVDFYLELQRSRRARKVAAFEAIPDQVQGPRIEIWHLEHAPSPRLRSRFG